MDAESGDHDPSEKGSTARLLFHAVLAVLGWILFAYFWRIVTAVGLSPGARIALIAMLIFVFILLASTTWWILHNRRIGRRNRRSSLPAAGGELSTTDTTGLAVEIGDPERLKSAPVIEITIDERTKRYRTVAGGDTRPPSRS